MKDRETAQEKLEYEIFSEQCFEQEKEKKEKRYCEGIDCAWCSEKEPCIYKIANELEEKLLRKEQECEELKKTIMYKCPQCGDEYLSPIGASLYEENNKIKQTIIEIIRFLKEDKKFARYSGYPIVFTSIVLEEIEKKLKENDIKISEVEND